MTLMARRLDAHVGTDPPGQDVKSLEDHVLIVGPTLFLEPVLSPSNSALTCSRVRPPFSISSITSRIEVRGSAAANGFYEGFRPVIR